MYLVFDIGGTRMRVGGSHDHRTIDAVIEAPTPQVFADGIAQLIAMCHEVAGGDLVEGVAGGLPGIVDEYGVLLRAPHLASWQHQDIVSLLSETFSSCPVKLGNDSALGGLGEARFGAGKGAHIVAYIALGTGIGGCRVVGGKLDVVRWGFEPGHQIIDTEKQESWEQRASGSGVLLRYGKRSEELEKDPKIWKQILHDFTIGIHNTILFWAPDVVVLGGGPMNSGAIQPEQLQERLYELPAVYDSWPELKTATLGDRAGLYGALALLQDTVG